jgi:hypothetical protein
MSSSMKVISLRPLRLASLNGMCVHIPANEATEIPAVLLSEALAAGCIPAEESDITALRESQVSADQDQIVRAEFISGGIEQLVSMNNTDDFSPTGVPRIVSLRTILGDDTITSTERDEVWASRYQNI